MTSLPALRASRLMVKMQWLREEAWFMGVSEMVRFVSPRNSCRPAEFGTQPEWNIHKSSSGSQCICRGLDGTASAPGPARGWLGSRDLLQGMALLLLLLLEYAIAG